MKPSVLQLSNVAARSYFLRASRYCTIPLPGYFDFQPLLNALNREIETKNIAELIKGKSKVNPTGNDKDYPRLFDGVNYRFLTNKDGNYAWRPLQILNPVIYICLLNTITEENNWKYIQQRFKKFRKDKRISCYSIPLVAEDSETKPSDDTAASINNWWEQIEQQSIELALQYNTVLVTDISDCYNSIYTHSIPWALYGKKESKRKVARGKKMSALGDEIDKLIRDMSYAQTNGIPQGSVLMDFIAEMVLGYADMELAKSKDIAGKDYKILRYRDDYKIFANSEEVAVQVAKVLSEVLSDLNLKLNPQKTFVSNKIIRDVIKPDKLYWNEAKHGEKTLQKHLLLIHSLAEKYPNSGTLSTAMSKFLDRIYPLKLLKEDSSKVLISVLVDIAYYNPRVYSSVVVCIGKILSIEPDRKVVDEIYELIEKKFDKKTNIGYWKVWFQRLTIKTDRAKEINSDEKLCQIAAGNGAIQLWEIKWLKAKYQRVIKSTRVFNNAMYDAMNDVPQPHEVKIFTY